MRLPTPTYVPVDDWLPITERIRNHIDLSNPATTAVLTIQGQSGVGKTRLTYEVLAANPAMEAFVGYTNDEQHAQDVARQLASDVSKTAILIADECALASRLLLDSIVRGHSQRIRVIAIDNTGERPATAAAQNWLNSISEPTVEQILSENFTHVPAERRALYASLSRGFVRLAADMCDNDAAIASEGHVGPIMQRILDYLHHRLGNDLEVLAALSLVLKVGNTQDVAGELQELCILVGLEPRAAARSIRRLQDSTGFVQKAGRYLYVTPEIVAQAALDWAWHQWIEDDPARFLVEIPPSLLGSFLRRVGQSALTEVRRTVGDHFRRWAVGLDSRRLADVSQAYSLIILTEADPDSYLPILRRLIDDANPEELLSLGQLVSTNIDTRRDLVWLLERLVAFPEYFDDAEEILFKLALTENEPAIANNATEIWKQLFRIRLSGTSTPFADRLKTLAERIRSSSEASALGLAAVDSILQPLAHRTVGPPIVAGRIPPAEWAPASNQELQQSFDSVVNLLIDLATSNDMQLRNRVYEVALEHIRNLLLRRYLPALQSIFDVSNAPDDIRAKAAVAVETCLHLDVRLESGILRADETYVGEVEAWLLRLRPEDIHGRLLSAVGADYWHYNIHVGESVWKDQLQSLASYLYGDLSELESELEWLFSSNAKSAPALGYELGKLDANGVLFELFVNSSLQYQATGLTRGYLGGLMETSPNLADKLNTVLDQVEQKNPKLAFELFTVAGAMTHAIERTLRLVDSGRLPIVFLRSFLYETRTSTISRRDYYEVLQRLVTAAEQNNLDAQRAAIDFIAYPIEQADKSNLLSPLDDANARALVQRLLRTITETADTESYHWQQIMLALVQYDPDDTAQIAAHACLESDYDLRGAGIEVLKVMAPTYPDLVMARLGEAILSPERGWNFYFGEYKSLIRALPIDVVKTWLLSVGVEGAQLIARHLPAPYLGPGLETVVPPLTEFVLSTFADSEAVLHQFFAGTQSKSYVWDIAAQKEQEAEVARRFLNHELKAIRDWAQLVVDSALEEAKLMRQWEEERQIQ